jgi:hypothetical protein
MCLEFNEFEDVLTWVCDEVRDECYEWLCGCLVRD